MRSLRDLDEPAIGASIDPRREASEIDFNLIEIGNQLNVSAPSSPEMQSRRRDKHLAVYRDYRRCVRYITDARSASSTKSSRLREEDAESPSRRRLTEEPCCRALITSDGSTPSVKLGLIGPDPGPEDRGGVSTTDSRV